MLLRRSELPSFCRSLSRQGLTVGQQELAAIWSMGFEADVVQRALLQAGGNEERAVNLIISDRWSRLEFSRDVLASLFFTLQCSVLTEEEWRLRLAAAPPAHPDSSDAQPAVAPASASRSTAPTACATKPILKRLQIITGSSC